MRYYGKHTGKTIDTQINRVLTGDVVIDNTSNAVTEGDRRPASGGAIYKFIATIRGWVDSAIEEITALKDWRDQQDEVLEGVEASAAIKIFKQQLAEIEAEFASIESIVATLIVKPADWLYYLDAYEAYYKKLKEVLKLKNPDSINVSGFDEARAIYIDTRDKLKKAINYQDALASQVALYHKEIVSVESQREAMLQEWANLLAKLRVLADSTGTGLVDKDGAALYVYDPAAETTTQYKRYYASANAYISKLRAMIAALDFNENDEYKQLRKDYYREYSLIKTMISQGRVNRFDSIDVTLGGYNNKINDLENAQALNELSANKDLLSSNMQGSTTIRHLKRVRTALEEERAYWGEKYSDIQTDVIYQEYYRYSGAFRAAIIQTLNKVTSGNPTVAIDTNFQSAYYAYLVAVDKIEDANTN